MFTKTYLKRIVRIHFLLASLALAIVMFTLAACGGGQAETAEATQPPASEEPVDPDARPYRMFFDSSADEAESELQIRQFTGQLRMADIESIFGDVDALPEDDNGNHVGGPVLKDGLVWRLVASPSQVGVNLVTHALDGTLSSAFDLDGDRVADIVDIRLGDGRRISFVTEELGMGIFEAWLLGENPLCNSELVQELGLESFGCRQEEEGGEEGSAGGAAGASAGSSFVDPLDLLCSEYGASRGFSSQVMALGSGERARDVYDTVAVFGEGASGGSRRQVTGIVENEAGEHLYTTKITYEYDSEGRLIQVIRERVDPSGGGTRQIYKYDPDSTDVTRGVTYREEDFEAELDEDGDYNSDETSPPPPAPSDPPPEGEPPEPPPEAPDAPNPGPDGDDTTIADFCARRGETTSGAEQAAATDPTAFRVGCGDLVGAPAGGDDCTILEWARAEDFEGALHPSGDDGCGEFEERGQGGDCEPSNTMEILRGRTALLLSANLEGVNLCALIACDPELFDQESAQPLSGEFPTEPLITVTPTQGSQPATVDTDTLCWEGPGPAYNVVSSVQAGVEVSLLGIGEIDGWFIIDNPRFPGANCWVEEQDIDVDPNLDLTALQVFPVPPPSTATPTKAPQQLPNPTGDACVPPPQGCPEGQYWSIATCGCEIFE